MIDQYCERIDAGFWSEPVNALTNLVFIVAGVVALSLLRRTAAAPVYMWVLAGLMILIGIGSFLFHTFATSLTALADVLPIYAFQLTFLWCYPRFALRLGRWPTGALLGLYLFATYLFSRLPFALNNSEMYFPAVLILGLYAIMARLRASPGGVLLMIAAALFVVALVARTVDEWWCAGWPPGTHFIWHTLNGAVLYLCWAGLYRAYPRRMQQSESPLP